MAEYLDKTGLAYFCGKLKEKLNKKADNDKYKVINISTHKIKNEFGDYTFSGSLLLDHPDRNNFAETFPSGYHIMCILAVQLGYFANETDYNNNSEILVMRGYDIMPIVNYGPGNEQFWVVYQEGGMNMYGSKEHYTLLLEKD